ncbi:hypothetical protein CKAN_02649600 [Cinnamomum micranthum f. kanehirae]|uniref:Transposase (putative) gypsy type domain-containing protein n=1 Tax=Cinnamomum micranthum f. kanehirae TaxID=337451 RepID=A0A443Q242_9MAGN|nr:hypothetical protein CKAN_02649600 [Cinnamomum micranthum f. kanehirae]
MCEITKMDITHIFMPHPISLYAHPAAKPPPPHPGERERDMEREGEEVCSGASVERNFGNFFTYLGCIQRRDELRAVWGVALTTTFIYTKGIGATLPPRFIHFDGSLELPLIDEAAVDGFQGGRPGGIRAWRRHGGSRGEQPRGGAAPAGAGLALPLVRQQQRAPGGRCWPGRRPGEAVAAAAPGAPGARPGETAVAAPGARARQQQRWAPREAAATALGAPGTQLGARVEGVVRAGAVGARVGTATTESGLGVCQAGGNSGVARQSSSSAGVGATREKTLRSCRRRYQGKVIVDDDGSKVSTLFSMFNTDGDISKIVASYHIPPTMLCRRAELDEPACDDSSGDIVIYEEMLEAGLTFPMSSCLCRILHYFSLTPGRLAPNGWRVLLGFLALWRGVHHEDASPVEFHAAYNLIESPAPSRGWYYLTPRGGKLLTGLRSNCHSWKSRFFFIGGEWASEIDRALVPVRWADAKRLDFPVLSKDQEQKLQAVKDHPDKDLGILLPKESGRISGPPPDPSSFVRTGGPSLGTSSKRKAVDREVIGARLSSRNAPPSKVAGADDTSRGNSSPVIKVSSLASIPSTGPRVCPHQVASAVVSSQPAASSASIATPESSSPTIPPAPRLCPSRSRASAGAPTWAGPMLGNPLVIREKLGQFVFPPEVTQINALGTEDVIDSFLEGLAQASTASICLLSRARHNSKLKQENEGMQKELSIAQRKIVALEAAGRASEADLTAARERATGFETALSAAHERAAKAEAELVKAREKASLSEAELVQTRERAALRETVTETEMRVARERASQAEERAILAEKKLANGLADAFIDGYQELRGKISAAFPDVDFSGFVPIEASDDSGSSDDDNDDAEDEDDGEDDDEDDGDSHESD